MNVYGIPSCGTVKKAKAWLSARNIAFEAIDFRATPPSTQQVEAWVNAFGAKAMRNTSGGAYRALPDSKKEWSEAQWTKAFAEDPMLIKRPILERDGKPLKVGFRGSDDELEAALL